MSVRMNRIRLLVGTGRSRTLPERFVHGGSGAASLEIVAQAHDGSAVIRKAAELRPEAVLVDTEMSGLEVLGLSGQLGRRGADARAVLFCLHAPTQTEASQHVLTSACAYVLDSTDLDDVARVIQDVHGSRCMHATESSNVVAPAKIADVLTLREREVLGFVAREMTSKEIGGVLRISPRTVDAHRANVMKKLGIHTIAGLVRYAVERGILDRETKR
jgi:DNA-binding NarL/FixJ family response regulator